MKTIENNNFYTIDEVANKLGVTRQTISNRISTGKIPAAKIDNKYYISEVFIELYIKERNKKLLDNVKVWQAKYEKKR
ncbi:helix-turn-helix domain-containing protein [Methanoculleus sp.]|uniref:helix-turn-helix domain-containing protein n=1 Tax=Methanoculleus sp. TaxID=90427 RepID=UPI0025EEA9DA|nr:helix-turn-helix domain-containing protein [Methanoculleus sp.]MCK9320255.1 helix-turn-helix domain-containing protein [Methanoculleus sp.]